MPASFYLVAVDGRCAPDQLPALGAWERSPDWHWLSLHALQIRPARLQQQLARLQAAGHESLIFTLLPGEAWELSVLAAGEALGPIQHRWDQPANPEADQLLAALGRLRRFESLPEELLRLLQPWPDGARSPSRSPYWANELIGDLPAFLQVLGLANIFTGFEALQRQERRQLAWQRHCERLEAQGSGNYVLAATRELELASLNGEPLTLPLADLNLLWRLAWFSEAENCPLLELVPGEGACNPAADWPAELEARWLDLPGRLCLAWPAGATSQSPLAGFDQVLAQLSARLQGEWILTLHCAPVPRLYGDSALNARPAASSRRVWRGHLDGAALRLSASYPALTAAELSAGLELARWARDGGSWRAPRREEALRLFRRLRNNRLLAPEALRLKGRELSLRRDARSAWSCRHQIARQLFLESAGQAWASEAGRLSLRALDRAWHSDPGAGLHRHHCLYRGASGDFYAGEPAGLPAALRQALEARTEALELADWDLLGDLVWEQAPDLLMRVLQHPDGLAWGCLLAEATALRFELSSPLPAGHAAAWLVTSQQPAQQAPPGLRLQSLPDADDRALWLAHRQALPALPLRLEPADLEDFLPQLDGFLQRISS